MEEDSPGGEYYHSPSSPASSSRNWTDDMEGGKRIRTGSVQVLYKDAQTVFGTGNEQGKMESPIF